MFLGRIAGDGKPRPLLGLGQKISVDPIHLAKYEFLLFLLPVTPGLCLQPVHAIDYFLYQYGHLQNNSWLTLKHSARLFGVAGNIHSPEPGQTLIPSATLRWVDASRGDFQMTSCEYFIPIQFLSSRSELDKCRSCPGIHLGMMPHTVVNLNDLTPRSGFFDLAFPGILWPCN